MKFNYMDGNNNILATVYVDSRTKEVSFINYTNNIFARPFGISETATFNDVIDFFKERTFPENRVNLKDILKQMGLKEYDPYLMCKKLKGRTEQDPYWIEFLED